MDSTAQMNTWFESVPLYFWNTVCSIDKRLKLEENKIMNRAGYCWRCEAPCTQHCSRCGMAYYCSKRCQQQDKWRHKPDCDAAALKMQCSGCNAKQEGMLKCTNCLNSYYCNAECQRSDWERHKTFCQEAVDKTLVLAGDMKELLEIKKDNPGLRFTYYWGNMPAVDLLNLSMNEGEEYSNPLALLLCAELVIQEMFYLRLFRCRMFILSMWVSFWMTSVLVPCQEQFCFYTYYTKVFWIIRCLFFNKSSCITCLTVSLSSSKQCHFQIIRLTVIDILGSQ